MSGDLLGVGCVYISQRYSMRYKSCHVLQHWSQLQICIQESLINFASWLFFSPLLPWLKNWVKLTRPIRTYCNSNFSSLLAYCLASRALTDRADISHIAYDKAYLFPSFFFVPQPLVKQLLQQACSSAVTHASKHTPFLRASAMQSSI